MLLGYGDGCWVAGTIHMEYISGDIMLYEWVNGFYIYMKDYMMNVHECAIMIYNGCKREYTNLRGIIIMGM